MDGVTHWCRVVLLGPDGGALGDWDAGAGCGPPTIAAVGELARLALEARRWGLTLRLEGASAATHALIELAGLSDVLGIEVGREPKGGEEAVVQHGEEIVQGGDPPA